MTSGHLFLHNALCHCYQYEKLKMKEKNQKTLVFLSLFSWMIQFRWICPKHILRMKSLTLLIQLSSCSPLMSICISAETLHVSKENQRFVVYWRGCKAAHSAVVIAAKYTSVAWVLLQCLRFQIRKYIPASLTENQHNITMTGIILLLHVSPWSWEKKMCTNWYIHIYTTHSIRIFWLISTGQAVKRLDVCEF